MKDKSFKVIFIIYIILTILDFVTTMKTGLVEYFEVNPLYQLTGSLLPILALNIVMVVLFYWLYSRIKSSPTTRFMIMNLMICVIFVRCLAVYNAVYWINNPVTVEVAKQIATEAAIQTSQKIYALSLYSPIILSFITFIGWKLDHRVTRKQY